MIYGPPIQSLVIAGNTTMYSGGLLRSPAFKVLNGANPNAETDVHLLIVDSRSASNLTVEISAAQPADGSTVFTVRKNGVATSVVVTIPASSPAGIYDSGMNVASFVPGDYYSLEAVKNGASVSPPVTACLHSFT